MIIAQAFYEKNTILKSFIFLFKESKNKCRCRQNYNYTITRLVKKITYQK